MIQSTKINGVSCYIHQSDSRIDDIYAAAGFGKTIAQIAKAEGADLAGNLPYAEYKINGIPLGRNVVGGKVITTDNDKTLARDSLYMMPDGEMHIGRPPAGVLWSLQGSPPLLENGVDVVDRGIDRDQLGRDIWANNAEHLRIAYGLKSPYELVIVRTREEITLREMAAIMKSLGCVNAINGDGGGSTTLYPADSGNGRKLGAALIIKKGDEPMTNSFKLIGDEEPELVIAPGHGGSDPGAQGNGIIEKILTLDAGVYLFDRFGELGVPRAITRNTDIYIGPADLAAMVKNSGAKYCISPHINAGGGDGAEVIHSINNDGKLANAIASAIKAAGQNVRRVFCRASDNNPKLDYYFMHRETGNVITNIVEFFFLDSKSNGPDADLNEYKTEWKDWLEAVVKAYCTYTGRKYTPPATSEPSKEKQSSFSDVPADHWADGVIAEAETYGLMGGYPDGTFKPNQQPTRAEMAAAMVKLFKKLGGV